MLLFRTSTLGNVTFLTLNSKNLTLGLSTNFMLEVIAFVHLYLNLFILAGRQKPGRYM